MAVTDKVKTAMQKGRIEKAKSKVSSSIISHFQCLQVLFFLTRVLKR